MEEAKAREEAMEVARQTAVRQAAAREVAMREAAAKETAMREAFAKEAAVREAAAREAAMEAATAQAAAITARVAQMEAAVTRTALSRAPERIEPAAVLVPAVPLPAAAEQSSACAAMRTRGVMLPTWGDAAVQPAPPAGYLTEMIEQARVKCFADVCEISEGAGVPW